MPALNPASDTASTTTTAKSIIKRAIRLLGGTATGEELAASELADGLEALNALLDSWNTEKLLVTAKVEESVSSSNQTITIGPGGDLDIVRPANLAPGDVFVVFSNVARQLDEMTPEQWVAAEVLALSSIPGRFYYEASSPLGKLHLDWTPDAAYTFKIFVDTQLNQISNVNASIRLTPGYVRALVYDLAMELAPEYPNTGANLTVIADTARYAKGNIKRVNNATPDIETDPALLGERASGMYYKRINQG